MRSRSGHPSNEMPVTRSRTNAGRNPSTATAGEISFDGVVAAITDLRQLLDDDRSLLSRTRGDGWRVGEVIAHMADIAEVFCERLQPGLFPGAIHTAVRGAQAGERI